jgi:hypothetical protein
MWPLLARCWWKFYLQDKDFDLYHVSGTEEHQFVPDALSRLCINIIPPPPTLAERMIVALRSAVEIPPDIYERLTVIHNSHRGHGGLQLCNHRLKDIHKKCLKMNLPPLDAIPDRMVNEFIRSCPYCQISNRLKILIKTHPFTCASYLKFFIWIKWIHPCYHWWFFQMGGALPHQINNSSWNSICYTSSYWSSILIKD